MPNEACVVCSGKLYPTRLPGILTCIDCGFDQEASCVAAQPVRGEAVPTWTDFENRVSDWIRTRIGEAGLHRRERAMRLLEEAAELAQAEGITQEITNRQVAHVFARPAGNPAQEAAGVAACLLGWCAATGNSLLELTRAEIERIEAKPIGQIRGSLARKADADLVYAPDECEALRVDASRNLLTMTHDRMVLIEAESDKLRCELAEALEALSVAAPYLSTRRISPAEQLKIQRILAKHQKNP